MRKKPRNRCQDCGYTWYPREKALASTCPRCGSFKTKLNPRHLDAVLLGLLIVATWGYIVATPPERPSAAAPASAFLPTPTSTLLLLGEWVYWDQLALSVTRQEITYTCPAGQGRPAEGAKFVMLHLAVHNRSDAVIEMPSLALDLHGYQPGLGSGSPECVDTPEAFGNACEPGRGQLYPEGRCEGWLLFEVPENLTLEKVTLKREGADPTEMAAWWLEKPLPGAP
jgi:predicted  nucleic acid-binding Zn-ribbon protein